MTIQNFLENKLNLEVPIFLKDQIWIKIKNKTFINVSDYVKLIKILNCKDLKIKYLKSNILILYPIY